MSQAAAQALSQNLDPPESIGRELREALPTMRLHSLSLHDAEGDVVWLSEGVLGPDEHGVVLEAMGAQSLEPQAPIVDRALGDGRNALILPARAGNGDVVGAAMLIIDSKQSGPALLPKLDTPRVRDALAKLAARHQPRPGARPAMAVPQLALQPVTVTATTPASEPFELTLLPDDPPPAVATAQPAAAASAAPPAPPALSAAAPAPAAKAPARPATTAAAPRAAALDGWPGSPPQVSTKPAPPVLRPATPADVAAATAASAAANEKRMAVAAAKIAAAARVPLAKQRVPAPAPPPAPPPRHAPTVRVPKLTSPPPARPAAQAGQAPVARAVKPVAPTPAAAPVPAAAATPPGPSLDGSLISELAIDLDADATVIAPKPEMRDLILVAQQLLKLRSGGRTRRYEVLLRSRSDPSRDAAPAALMQALTAADATSGIDRYVLTELVQWLGKHPQVWETDPSSFTVNLTTGTLRDRGFLRFASALFDEWKVSPGVIGFEIPERACIDAGAEIRGFIERCEKLGCFIALDDFSMHSEAVPFLASPALRLVKIDARLTAAAMKDKLSQAMVIAISQASKVLGVHCVAKRIESAMARQWLSAIGIDFAQGFALERPQTLDALLKLAPAARTSTPS